MNGLLQFGLVMGLCLAVLGLLGGPVAVVTATLLWEGIFRLAASEQP